jgi:hypothetical protein
VKFNLQIVSQICLIRQNAGRLFTAKMIGALIVNKEKSGSMNAASSDIKTEEAP